MQSDYILCHNLTQQCLDCSGLAERSFRWTPVGRHDCLMRQQHDPESKRTWNNGQLCDALMVLTVQIVARCFILGDDLGSMEANLMSLLSAS